jgi:hypothetical protein
MAAQVYKGFWTALEAGSLASPDIRYGLYMSGFSFDADSINLADGTLDEFDGVGYARVDAASVTSGYVDADDEWQLDSSDAVFGDPVAPGSEVIAGMFGYLHVDGTAANDIILFSTDEGGFGVNANNGSLSFALPTGGILAGA